MSGAILQSTISLHGVQKNKYYFYIISFYFCSDYQFFKKTNKYYLYTLINFYYYLLSHKRYAFTITFLKQTLSLDL